MAAYSNKERDAIHRAQQILSNAGLDAGALINNIVPHNSAVSVQSNFEEKRIISPEDILKGEGRVTRERTSSVHAIIEHPADAIIEFPESGHNAGYAIAHIFPVNPDIDKFVNPKDNIQYSLGGNHGQRKNIKCYFLQRYSKTNSPVTCTRVKTGCRSIKYCSFADTSDLDMRFQTAPATNAAQEVFAKTLGFFCALKDRGCRWDTQTNAGVDMGGNSELNKEAEEKDKDLVYTLTNSRTSSHGAERCAGKLIFEYVSNRPLVRCELHKKGEHGHLILRNIGEFDLNYLQALMMNDVARINVYELDAQSKGYGPLVHCKTTCAYREQKELCASWHRDSKGILQRGKLVKANDCKAHFEIYKPDNLHDCPYVLMVCRNPHSHPNPSRIRTPKSIRLQFIDLMYRLDWRLADATPRRLFLDNGFMTDLRNTLKWQEIRDPTLTDLHPSFGNHDHTSRLIEEIRLKRYPNGTGLEGAEALFEEQSQGPLSDRYIRYIQEHKISNDGYIYIVICMFPIMSHLFHKTTRPSLDTSFKRLQKWQEFEVEAWFPEYSRSLVLARAFTTSQSAEAHQILFREMFRIVKEDTGTAVQFRHIHGTGFETITADGHSGQALGLGLYLREICHGEEKDSVEWNKQLKDLTPTEHLACIYRYCFAHYLRNITSLKNSVSHEVRAAMISLASAENLPNLDEVLELIRNGGKKAADWLADKEASNKMALAGIYRPYSKIPIDIWKAAPTTSNGNEQAHRNINRDGTRLTMLAGIMRGLQYDSRLIQGCLTFEREGIQTRDQASTHFRRAGKGIWKKERIQQKIVEQKDTQISEVNDKILKLQETVVKNTKSALKAKTPEKAEKAMKRLQQSEGALQDNHTKLKRLITQGSGRVVPEGVLPIQEVLDPRFLHIRTGVSELAPKSDIQPTSTPAHPNSVHPQPTSQLPVQKEQTPIAVPHTATLSRFSPSHQNLPVPVSNPRPVYNTRPVHNTLRITKPRLVSNPYPVRNAPVRRNPYPVVRNPPVSNPYPVVRNPPVSNPYPVRNAYPQPHLSYHPTLSSQNHSRYLASDYPLNTGASGAVPASASSSHSLQDDPFQSTLNLHPSHHN